MDKKKKVAIVGFAPSSKDLAPYDDKDWEIWVLNEYFSILPKSGASNITRWFEIHQRDTVLNSHRSKDYLQKLKDSKIPIMMCKKEDDIPMSEAYPLDDIIESLKTDYFTNSISYMVAQAIYEGYDAISLFGIDMAQEEEYAKERPSVEYFVGYARAKGIEVYIPDQSDICKVPYYYGFQEESASKINRTLDPKIKDLKDRIAGDDNAVDEMLEHIDYYIKKYLLEIKPMVEEARVNSEKVRKLNESLGNPSIPEAEKSEIIKAIQFMPNINIPIFDIDKIVSAIWESNQRLKGAKKERLYLAGASETANHLRTLLCPYD